MSSIEFETPELTIDTVQIDPEFEAIFRDQTEAEWNVFRKSILKFGFLDSLKVWFDPEQSVFVILDGHNRWKLWDQLFRGDDTRTPELEPIDLPDREAANKWIDDFQKGRRNLADIDKVADVLLREPEIREKAKANQSAAGNPLGKSASDEITKSTPVNTRAELAGMAGMGEQKFDQLKTVLESGDDEVIEEVRSGEKSANAAAKELSQVDGYSPFKKAATEPAKPRENLADLLSRCVHDRCPDAPHDIGLILLAIVRTHIKKNGSKI